MRLISFVIPCYRSSKTISKVVHEIETTVKLKNNNDYEVILVNDSSPDDTIQVISELAKNNKSVKVIDLAKNYGQQNAIMAGFNFAEGDVIVCLDDDGQTPPSEMYKLIDKLDEGFDIVFAKYENKKHSLFRNFGSQVNELMAVELIGKPKDISFSSYFACKSFIVKEAIRYDKSFPYIGGLFLRTSNRIANVYVDHKQRESGESGYTIKKLLSVWLNGFTAFSVKPLRASAFIGVVFALLGLLFSIYILINKILNPDVLLGWSSTTAVVSLIGGIILFMLGIIGEYIGRIYICLNNAPQYVIRDTINLKSCNSKSINDINKEAKR